MGNPRPQTDLDSTPQAKDIETEIEIERGRTVGCMQGAAHKTNLTFPEPLQRIRRGSSAPNLHHTPVAVSVGGNLRHIAHGRGRHAQHLQVPILQPIQAAELVDRAADLDDERPAGGLQDAVIGSVHGHDLEILCGARRVRKRVKAKEKEKRDYYNTSSCHLVRVVLAFVRQRLLYANRQSCEPTNSSEGVVS